MHLRRCLLHLRQSQQHSASAWRSTGMLSTASCAAHFHHHHPDHAHEEHAHCHTLASHLATAADLPSACGVGSADPVTTLLPPIATIVDLGACHRRLPSSVIGFQIVGSGSDTTRAELDPCFAGVATSGFRACPADAIDKDFVTIAGSVDPPILPTPSSIPLISSMRLCLFVNRSSLIGSAPSNLYPFSLHFSHLEAVFGVLRSLDFQFLPDPAPASRPCLLHHSVVACLHDFPSPTIAASRRLCLLAFLPDCRYHSMRWRRHQPAAVQTYHSVPSARLFRLSNLTCRCYATTSTASCSSGNAMSSGSSCSGSDSGCCPTEIADSRTIQY